MTDTSTVESVAAEVGEELEADIFFLSAAISRQTEWQLHAQWARSHERKRCVLIVATMGGDPNAAYLMARFLRRVYEHVTVAVFGVCKSAGTLLALGGHEIAMGVHGELGPLDIQTPKDDDLVNVASGLDIITAVAQVIQVSVDAFESSFLRVIERSGGTITTKTAADIACRLSEGVLQPMARQIDPVRLGEQTRAVQIATEYGKRLGVPDDALVRLTGNYPSHGFVIDLEEAESFLSNVRPPSEAELRLEAVLAAFDARVYFQDAQLSVVACIGGPDFDQRELFHDGLEQAASEDGAGAPDEELGPDPAESDGAEASAAAADGAGEDDPPTNGVDPEQDEAGLLDGPPAVG